MCRCKGAACDLHDCFIYWILNAPNNHSSRNDNKQRAWQTRALVAASRQRSSLDQCTRIVDFGIALLRPPPHTMLYVYVALSVLGFQPSEIKRLDVNQKNPRISGARNDRMVLGTRELLIEGSSSVTLSIRFENGAKSESS